MYFHLANYDTLIKNYAHFYARQIGAVSTLKPEVRQYYPICGGVMFLISPSKTSLGLQRSAGQTLFIGRRENRWNPAGRTLETESRHDANFVVNGGTA